MNGNSFDKEVEEYEEWFKINDQIYKSELEAVRALLPTSGRGMEIGIGTGLFASVLGIKEGVDPSEAMAMAAKRKGLKVLKGYAEDLPFGDNTFDYILMVTVDCFLNDIFKAFSEIKRTLKENGSLTIAFLDKGTDLGKIYDENKHLHESYKKAKFHTSDEMINLLEKSGFAVIDKRQTIYNLDNCFQEVKQGTGEGLFAVVKAIIVGT